MARTGVFEVEGVVAAVLSDKTYRVELANGHQLLGFIPGKARGNSSRLAPGESVRIELSPYDLSEGRIIVGTETK